VLIEPVSKVLIVSGLSLGILGPASMGGRTHELIHKYTNPSHPPQAWAQQIRNDFILNFDLKVEKAIYVTTATLMGMQGRGRFRTLHTDMEARQKASHATSFTLTLATIFSFLILYKNS